MKYLNLNNEVALELMALVLNRLTALGLEVHCTAYAVYVQSGIVELKLKPPAGSKTRMQAIMSVAQDIALAVGYKETRVVFGDSTVNIEIPAGHPKVITLQSLRPALLPGKMLIGKTLKSQPLYVDPADSNTPHVLIAGTSGGGKSALWHLMACSIAMSTPPSAVRMLMYDAAHRQPQWLLRHVSKHLALPLMHDAATVIKHLRELSAFVDTGQPLDHRLIVFVDEVANLIDIGGDEVRQLLRHIAQQGRNSKIHLVIATQKPSAKLLDGGLLSNLNCKLVLTVASESDSRLCSGGKHIGAHLLPGKGAGVMVIPTEIVRFTGGLPDGYDKDYGPQGGKQTDGTGVFGAGAGDVHVSMPRNPRISAAVQRAREVDAAFLQSAQAMGNAVRGDAAPAIAAPRPVRQVAAPVAPARAPIITPAPVMEASPEGDGAFDVGVFEPAGEGAPRMPADISLGELLEGIYARNPDVSMGLLQKVLKVRGRADGFYVIKGELDKRGIKLKGMQ